MARIFKNKTAEDASIIHSTTTYVVPAGQQVELATVFEQWQLAASESLLLLLAQGPDKYALNDGSRDLSAVEAIDLIHGYQPAVAREPDGRTVVRQTVARSGKARMQAYTFYTADPSKLYYFAAADKSTLPGVSSKCYNAAGVEVSGDDLATAVKTVVDFEPPHNFSIIGGEIEIPSDIRNGATDSWWASCIAVPDVPPAQGGSISHANCVNLECLDGVMDLDGRAATDLTYNALYHSNKIRVTVFHPAGVSKRFQVFMELFF